MIDAMDLMGTVFSGLSALVIEDVEDDGGAVCVRARTRDEPAACPGCGTQTARVHGYYERTAADVPIDGRRVLVKVRVRRMRCPVTGCPRQTFREQVPGVLDRYQRRTTRLTGQVAAVARELAGRASARLLPAQVHDLRARNVGLLDCARRLNLSLGTVKRYDRASEPQRVQRVPKYRPTLADRHRGYLRKRRAEEPGVPVRQLLREIRELGHQGSSNLLVRYVNQGRLDSGRPHLSPSRATRILLTRPDRLTAGQHETLAALTQPAPR